MSSRVLSRGIGVLELYPDAVGEDLADGRWAWWVGEYEEDFLGGLAVDQGHGLVMDTMGGGYSCGD